MSEEWRPIPGFENYQISNQGRLSFDGFYIDGRKKSKRVSKAKSHEICLRKDGENHWFRRAQLVLLAFVGAPASKELYNARHLDDNPDNNNLSNLSWGTASDNHDDAVRNGKHAIKGTQEALKYAIKLKGVPRSEEIKKKISHTKRSFPERQRYGGKKDSKTGRWVS